MVVQVLVGVYFFVAVMGCLLGIKRFAYAVLLVPLAVGVLVFHVLVSCWILLPILMTVTSNASSEHLVCALQQHWASSALAPTMTRHPCSCDLPS